MQLETDSNQSPEEKKTPLKKRVLRQVGLLLLYASGGFLGSVTIRGLGNGWWDFGFTVLAYIIASVGFFALVLLVIRNFAKRGLDKTSVILALVMVFCMVGCSLLFFLNTQKAMGRELDYGLSVYDDAQCFSLSEKQKLEAYGVLVFGDPKIEKNYPYGSKVLVTLEDGTTLEGTCILSRITWVVHRK